MCCQIKSTELYWSAFHLIVLWYLMQWLSFNLKKYYIVAFDCFVLPLHFIFKGQVGIKGRGQKDLRVREGQGGGQKHSWWCSVQRNHYSLSAALPDKTHQTDGWQNNKQILQSLNLRVSNPQNATQNKDGCGILDLLHPPCTNSDI